MNALGEVSMRAAHKNTGLWPLKPFLSWILPLSFSLCCIWETEANIAAPFPSEQPWLRVLVEPDLYPIPGPTPAWICWECFLEC